MGAALAAAVLEAGHQARVVSGPVEVAYPAAAEVVSVVSTEEMLQACLDAFPACDGLIAVAAPCDYQPRAVAANKIRKSGQPLRLELVETPDVVAELAAIKGGQWIVGFALETEDQRFRAMQKLERKSCDLIVLNGPQAISAADTQIEILNRQGQSLGYCSGSKMEVARKILAVVDAQLIRPRHC